MKIKILMLILLLSLFACDKKESEPIDERETGISNSAESREQEFIRVQDSILQNYASAIRLVNQIDTELSKIANIPNKSEGRSYEQQIIQKIEYLAFQLKTRNDDIARLEKKIKTISAKNKELTEKIATIESIIEEKNIIIESQIKRINKLESDMGVVIQERDIAIESKVKTEVALDKQIVEKNTAYYIIGTEKELVANNIIKMEGEGFLGIGGKWVQNPQADYSKFNKINILNDTEIKFPSNYKIDEVVSSHNINFISLIPNEAGSSNLKISNPEGFWKTEKKLIIMVKEK